MKPSVRCCLSGGRGPSVRMESVPSLQKPATSDASPSLRSPLVFFFFPSYSYRTLLGYRGGLGAIGGRWTGCLYLLFTRFC